MEKDINKLTGAILESCSGLNSAIVIGACLNVIMSVMNYSPNRAVALGVANSLKEISTKLETLANGLN